MTKLEALIANTEKFKKGEYDGREVSISALIIGIVDVLKSLKDSPYTVGIK